MCEGQSRVQGTKGATTWKVARNGVPSRGATGPKKRIEFALGS